MGWRLPRPAEWLGGRGDFPKGFRCTQGTAHGTVGAFIASKIKEAMGWLNGDHYLE